MIKQDIDAILDKIRTNEDTIFQSLGIPSDYSEKSLELLEAFIDTIAPVEGEPQDGTIVVACGFYLGESIVRNFKGSMWNTDVDSIWDTEVIIQKSNDPDQTIVIKPILRTLKYWRDRSDGLAVMYRTVNMFTLDFLDTALEKTPEGKWKKFANGDQVRVFSPNK